MATQHAIQKAPRSFWPYLAVFLVSAGALTYNTAISEGSSIDKARQRFLTAKQRNDLRMSGGESIVHEDERAARLPETYHGIGDLRRWSNEARFFSKQ